MTQIANPTDADLQDAVILAIRELVGRHAPQVGVAADHGTISLTGQLPTTEERVLAHSAARGVDGVHSVADDIAVRDAHSSGHTDTELAKLAQAALYHETGIPFEAVIAEVSDQTVTLTGTVRSTSERLAAERAVIYLPGLTRIENHIRLADPTN